MLTYNFGLGSSNNGNVLGITHSLDAGRNQTFTYDQLNRIKTAEVPTAWGLSFGYDIWGNLLSQTVTKGSAPMLSVAATTKNQISGFCYDAAGNLLRQAACAPTNDYTYDAENRLTSTAGVTYTYDGDGKRVMKSNGTLYWHGPAGEVLMETDLAGSNPVSGGYPTEYIFFNGQHVARRVGYAGVSYFFSDHLGSSRIVTDSAGTVVEDSDFYPFGGERVVVDSLNNNYKFTGQERDAESGLDFFIARHYAFSLGRFLQPDSIDNDFVLADPRSLNRYGYVRNNPLKFTDPSGERIVLTARSWWERLEQLNDIRESLGNEEAADRLGIGYDEETDQYFVEIGGSIDEFKAMGKLEARLAFLVESPKDVLFSLGRRVSYWDDPSVLGAKGRDIPFLNSLLFKITKDVGDWYSGGVTVSDEVSLSGNVEVVVDPTDIRGGATLGETVAHELLGEAFARLKGTPSHAVHAEGERAQRERRMRTERQKGPEPKR